MRLRKECEHGRYDAHDDKGLGQPKGWNTCPGGEFLPEGALVIEKEDGEWPDRTLWALSRVILRIDREPYELEADEMRAVLDALASQVGESE